MWIAVTAALCLALVRILSNGARVMREHTPGTLDAWAVSYIGDEDQFRKWNEEIEESKKNPIELSTVSDQ